ncbi:MAG TPA: AI-2E family transporter [Verrucomicrobiae bacterium]|nr:AI-2E family transporter [Verrucomicrobiae bacterium]
MSNLAVGVFVIAALYFAREVFVPLALALLLSFALGPLVMFLRRWHVGRMPSVIAAVLLAFVLIFSLGSVIGNQLAHLAENLPQYQTNVAEKIHSLQGSATGGGVVGRASAMLKRLSDEITHSTPAAAGDEITHSTPAAATRAPVAVPAAPRSSTQPAPIPVEIHQPDLTAFEVLQTIIGPLLQPLATTGIVIVFVVFFLLQREDLRDRFIRLAGAHDLQKTTKALDDAAQRLSRYLLMQLAINATFGILIGTGLWLIGIPNPVLWGILAMLLRFVPYIGPIIAAIFPAALALAIDPGWSMLVWTACLFLVVEPLMGQAVEPLLYGHSTGLSAVAIVVAAAFWTWLWGPIGLLLSTPLTLCLVVLGRHVERLEFLAIILGDQPALTLEENFYQRVLANDPDEAAHQAEVYLKSKPLAEYYDEVAIRGLALAQLDVNRGVLEHVRRVQIKEAILGLIDDLSDHLDSPPVAEADAAGGEAATPPPPSAPLPADDRRRVLCIAGRGSLDEAAAAMLAQLLGRQGIQASVVSSDAVAPVAVSSLEAANVQIVCLSYLEPGGFTNARYLVRRLRRKLPRVRILVGLWTLNDEDARQRDALRETGADLIVTSLRQAVEQIRAATEALIQAEAPDRTQFPLSLAAS